ncbi:Retrotransposable element Tf2 protein type 1 [Aphis craccivora]|uniref:Retrotransposable element Tf2 protein type 1 n=1 Tax=Aphis craccivora TaxID=307492 RepID=A0A6G0YLJ7_APHCR|nr:Retrotransposable element Tf2 protein type 1 [Aphis craccivora]
MPKITFDIETLNSLIVLNMIKYHNIISLVESIAVHLLQTRDDFLQIITGAIQNPEDIYKVITVTNNIQLDSERSEECIDFTMMCFLFFVFVSVYSITSRNNAPISNYGGGFRCKSECPWYIIEVKNVIEHFHNEKMFGAHLGVHKVFNKTRSRYHWPTMQTFIKNYGRKPDKQPLASDWNDLCLAHEVLLQNFVLLLPFDHTETRTLNQRHTIC